MLNNGMVGREEEVTSLKSKKGELQFKQFKKTGKKVTITLMLMIYPGLHSLVISMNCLLVL